MAAKIKLGFVPTRRSVFSAPDALKYRDLTAARLTELGIDFVDIKDINPEGLLFADEDVKKIVDKFRREKVDGIILAHCNFGTEYVCARLARELNLPVLLWGPLDEAPLPDGRRLRDTQCGLFATGKVLRRFQVKFTYLTNCRLSDPVFERGLRDFMAVCNVVRTFRHIRILQMGPRPFDFWTTMCNEGELLEKFNIQLSPFRCQSSFVKCAALRIATGHKRNWPSYTTRLSLRSLSPKLKPSPRWPVRCAICWKNMVAMPVPFSAGRPCKVSLVSCRAPLTPFSMT